MIFHSSSRVSKALHYINSESAEIRLLKFNFFHYSLPKFPKSHEIAGRS